MDGIELHVPPDVVYVGLARLVVTTAARQSGMDDGRVEDLKIAVSEATTNAILAHQRIDEDRPVVLGFGPREGQFEVTIQDTGPGFHPGPETEPKPEFEDPDWPDEGGLGVTVIRGLTDDVRFIREAGTRVHMRFAISLDVDGAGPP